MRQGSRRKIFFLVLALAAIAFVAVLIFLNLKKQNISADVIALNDIKTIDVRELEPDNRPVVRIPILMYHHIRDFNDPGDTLGTNLSVSEGAFSEQLDYLISSGYTTTTFQQMIEFPQKSLPEKPIILTFDDGYDDNYNAFISLKNKNMVGVFYIISNYLNKPGQLSTPQIKEISSAGMEIGSHTENHPDLTQISASRVSAELSDSKAELEKIIGKNVISLCYPSGRYNDAVKHAVEQAQYLAATTTQTGIATTDSDKFELQRIRISHPDTLQTFVSKLKSE